MRVFAFDRDLIIQVVFFVVRGPGVAEISGLAEAVGCGQIAYVFIVDWLTVRANKNCNVPYPAVVVESDNDILVTAVMIENPNLLAFVFRFEVAKFSELCVGLGVGHP